MSDRLVAHAGIDDEMNAHAVGVNMDGTFVVAGSRVVSGNNAGVSVIGKDETRCVYNNIIQDTNWTSIDNDSPLPETNRTAATTISGTSRCAGNVVGLSERLRSILALKQVSGGQRGGMMQS
jgi:hypothetical protein